MSPLCIVKQTINDMFDEKGLECGDMSLLDVARRVAPIKSAVMPAHSKEVPYIQR